MIDPGSTLTLDIEKPAAGGRMLARHQGQVVLVSHAIPGERVRARVERAGKGVAFAETTDVVTASPDRRPAPDWRCGGNLLAHMAYERQLRTKQEILQDAFARIGRAPLEQPPAMIGSPERGYRMRARLHASHGRFGFYREATHQLCDPEVTGQLLPSTVAWLREVESAIPAGETQAVRGLELSEDLPGETRAAWLEVAHPSAGEWFAPLAGPEAIVDRLDAGAAVPLELRRSARSFFQGNRFLLERMLAHVVSLVPEGPVVDLYAGVGLFGLALAARGADVRLVEGDHSSGADLVANARPYGDSARVIQMSVESYVKAQDAPARTFVVDPPRKGLSTEAMEGVLGHRPATLVYVSCDPATLARDARLLLDAGYQRGPVAGFDLFPNTAHVEAVVEFRR